MTLRLALAALALSVSAAAQEPAPPRPLSLEQQTALKCSAAFAIAATLQQRGEGRQWPTLGERGREFFVRTAAKIMDETGRSREQVAAALTVQARTLTEPAAHGAAMSPCLLLLDASGA